MACKLIAAAKVVPIHWGTFPVLTGTPEAFARELGRQGVPSELVVLQPGDIY